MLVKGATSVVRMAESGLVLNGFLTRVMHALSFLSRIPVHDTFFQGRQVDMLAATRVFPVAGLLIALPSAILVAILHHAHADPLLTAALTLALATAITGALHEDGLADTADGFGGGADKEHSLTIMKDSRIGSYGAIALILSFMIRVAAIATLIRDAQGTAIAASLIAVASFSRAMMVWHWHGLPPARQAGVAASIGQPGSTDRNHALAYGIGMSGLMLWSSYTIIAATIAIAASFAAAYLFKHLCLRKIEGHTGDTIGATQQITEIVMLVALALLV
ncbi:adenosylcobinamide-GDP ribazoletransferase [Rhizobium sp. SORGH_AS 787]|nr:adenosylcobinamide-GDP ribazoletransferase [Rhizobium sp. SORGH_AS_0787]